MKSMVNGFAIDAEVAEGTDCSKCGKKMSYRPDFEGEGKDRIYRAFAVCEPCGEEIEF